MTDIPNVELPWLDPFRRPGWRWERASYLVESGKYFSKKFDDRATGIAVKYLRAMEKRSGKGQIDSRFCHVHRARRQFEATRGHRLEIETRMLARQSDTAIAYHLDLPPETVQAYRDLFFDIDGRIDATGYILHNVIGFHSHVPANARSLMKMAAYFQGPEVIEHWMDYIGNGWNGVDLNTERERLLAMIDILVDSQQLTESPKNYPTFTRNASILMDSDSEPSRQVMVAMAFSHLCAQINANLPLPMAKLPPRSYFAGTKNPRPSRQNLKCSK